MACKLTRLSCGSCPGAMLAWYWNTSVDGSGHRLTKPSRWRHICQVSRSRPSTSRSATSIRTSSRVSPTNEIPACLRTGVCPAAAAAEPLRLNCFGPRAGVDHGRDAAAGLREADQPGTELHHSTELIQAEPQRLLDAPLRRDQARCIGDVRAVLQRLRLSATEGHPAVGTGRADPPRPPPPGG